MIPLARRMQRASAPSLNSSKLAASSLQRCSQTDPLTSRLAGRAEICQNPKAPNMRRTMSRNHPRVCQARFAPQSDSTFSVIPTEVTDVNEVNALREARFSVFASVLRGFISTIRSHLIHGNLQIAPAPAQCCCIFSHFVRKSESHHEVTG